jgi:hypothetical protein
MLARLGRGLMKPRGVLMTTDAFSQMELHLASVHGYSTSRARRERPLSRYGNQSRRRVRTLQPYWAQGSPTHNFHIVSRTLPGAVIIFLRLARQCRSKCHLTTWHSTVPFDGPFK